jgi:hypothetical protein
LASARADAQALERDAVAQRVVGRRQVALDVVRERVHAGGGGDGAGQRERGLGVGEHHLGQQLGAEDGALDVRAAVLGVFRHHRRAAHLGAGARRRGQRHEVGQFVDDGTHLRVVPDVFDDVAVVHRHQRHDLRDVERGATAEGDHAVGTVRLERRRAGHHLAGGRVAEDAVEHADVQPAQVAAEFGQHRQRAERTVGDDQRALQPLLQQVRTDERARAGAEVDGRRERELGDGHRGCFQMISK